MTEALGEGSIYEVSCCPKCPVQNCLLRVSVFNPKQKIFWQNPKASIKESDKIWFQTMALGVKSLSNLMLELYDLSRRCTNHSLRAMSTQTLNDADVESRHRSDRPQERSFSEELREATVWRRNLRHLSRSCWLVRTSFLPARNNFCLV